MLTCRLLGPVEVWFDDKQINLGYPRQRSLLAILLVDANRLVTLDSLINRIWADHPPARAAHTLYADLSKLRRVLTPLPGLDLVRHTGGYLIEADPQAIDLHRFRDLVARTPRSQHDEDAAALLDEALALWHGEPFTDLDNAWLGTIRASLNTEKHAAILDRNDAQLRLGRHTHLLTDLAITTATQPLDERLAAQYMLALYRSGRSGEALTHYQRTRQRLIAELGVDPSPDLRELHEQILRNDPTLRTTARPAPARPLTPRQLPAHAPHFIGRAAELAALDDLLDTAIDAGTDAGGTVVISAISGAGGIGKTWLALHWAYQHLDRFPDGQLFVDLRGFAPVGEPMTPATAVRGFLDGLGVAPGRIPAGLDAQVALYRSTLAGKRMVIVLDNAVDAAQITPLLPSSPGCAVLVTSRRYLPSLVTSHHARHIQLGVLTETEARHLLRARLGTDRVESDGEIAAVETLLACCGGFPLALGIVIGRALAHPEFPLSVLAAELSDTTSALGALDDGDAAASLPAVLSWSVRALTSEQIRVFGLVGIAPGPDISLPAAAALTALSTRQARAVLRKLEHASLVQQHLPGRYRMHDLIRRYATDTATPEVREPALRRVMDFYTQTAHTADLRLRPHRPPIRLDPPKPSVHPPPLPDVTAALAWLDIEHPVLLAAQHTAAGQAWHATVWQLAWTLETFQARRGHRHDRLAVWEAALDAAAHLPDPTTRIIAHRTLGHAHANLGYREEAIGHLHQALALATEHHDPDQQIRTHRVLASAWAQRGDDQHALAHATRALDLCRTLDQPVWEADALNHVGWYAARLGQYDTARTHCEAALTLHQRHHNADGEASTLDSLGYVAHHTGEHRQAIDYYQRALTMLRTLGNSSEAANTLDRLGHPHVALGEYEEARVVWQEALELYQQQGLDDDLARVQRQLDDLDERVTPSGGDR